MGEHFSQQRTTTDTCLKRKVSFYLMCANCCFNCERLYGKLWEVLEEFNFFPALKLILSPSYDVDW